jgi:hypothetical protein
VAFPVAPPHARESLNLAKIPPYLIEGQHYPWMSCLLEGIQGPQSDLQLDPVMVESSVGPDCMELYYVVVSTHVDVDLNIVVVLVVNAQGPSVTVVDGNTGVCYMLSVDTDDDDDDVAVVQDSSTSLLNCH